MILYYPQEANAELLPGTIVFMICEDGEEHKGEMSLRKARLEVRDSIRYFHGTPTKHLTVVVARKPLQGTVAENVLKYGRGGINVGCSRIPYQGDYKNPTRKDGTVNSGGSFGGGVKVFDNAAAEALGRWPANIIHDGGCDSLFPETGPASGAPRNNNPCKSVAKGRDSAHVVKGHADAGGSASRFFHLAKSETALIEYLERLVKA